jgi:hypothetical protein
MIMEMKLRIQRYSQVFKRVGMGYKELTFVFVHQNVSFFFWKRVSELVNAEFHIVSRASASYKITVRSQQTTNVR